jgi:hypothetical protein
VRRAAIIAACAFVTGCGSCVALDSPVAFPCAPDGGSEQCAAGWRCGLDGRCHDTSIGAALACASDTDCEQSWRCGLDGACHDRDAGAPYLCEMDSDCERGWRCECCGEPKRCHPRDAAAAYPCRDDSDCEADWQCGKDSVCHDRSVGAPLPCASDHDCTGGWRCGLDAICVDATFESLQPAYEGPLKVELLSPLRGVETAEQVAASNSPYAITLLHDGGLTHFMNGAAGQAPVRFALRLDGGAVASLVTIGAQTFLLDEAGFASVDWSSGTLRRIHDGLGAQRLRVDDSLGLLIGISDGGGWVYDWAADVTTPLPAASAEIYDVAVMNWGEGFGQDLRNIYVATADGLFSASLTDGGIAPWVPLTGASVPNAQCGPAWTDAGTTYRVQRIDSMTAYQQNMTVIATTTSGSDQVFFEGQLFAYGQDRLFACAATPSVQPGWPCPVCPPGELVDFIANTYVVTAHCRGPTGGSDVRALGMINDTSNLPGVCPTSYPGTYFDRSRAVSSHQGTMVLATAHGHVRQLPESYPYDSMVLDQAVPIVRTDGGLWAGVDPYDEGIGFVNSEPRRDPTVPVEQDPGELSAPITTSDGGPWVVAAAPFPQDSILLGGADGGPLSFRVSPRPFSSITSIAALPPFARPDGGVPFAAGYVLTVDGLFYFEASSSSDWRSQEILLPPGRYVSVWTDGMAGRVAADDGTVLSLPSLLVLGAPFPDGGTASEYRRVCNQPYALASSGIFRLQRPVDGGVGSWSPVDVSFVPGFDSDPGLGPPAPARGYTPLARLDLLGQELFVTNTYGAVLRITPPMSCP